MNTSFLSVDVPHIVYIESHQKSLRCKRFLFIKILHNYNYLRRLEQKESKYCSNRKQDKVGAKARQVFFSGKSKQNI